LLVESQVLEEQLEQVLAAYGTALQGEGSRGCSGFLTGVPRCPVCNGALAEVPKEQARAHVPVYVWETHDCFHRCRECGKLYWPGSHWERIQSTLARIARHEACDRATVVPESLTESTGLSSRS
jgi:uncharacterized protein with PIN domain